MEKTRAWVYIKGVTTYGKEKLARSSNTFGFVQQTVMNDYRKDTTDEPRSVYVHSTGTTMGVSGGSETKHNEVIEESKRKGKSTTKCVRK